MIILQIEHKVISYEDWVKTFDSDPINRRKSGVRRYSILRPTNDQNYVIIDLEFDTLKNAEKALTNLHKLWTNIEGKVIVNPKTRFLNIIETIEY